MAAPSIHDLFALVKAHPDFRFGTIFVAADVDGETHDEPAYAGWYDEDTNHEHHAELHLVEAGWEYLNNECKEGAA